MCVSIDAQLENTLYQMEIVIIASLIVMNAKIIYLVRLAQEVISFWKIRKAVFLDLDAPMVIT